MHTAYYGIQHLHVGSSQIVIAFMVWSSYCWCSTRGCWAGFQSRQSLLPGTTGGGMQGEDRRRQQQSHLGTGIEFLRELAGRLDDGYAVGRRHDRAPRPTLRRRTVRLVSAEIHSRYRGRITTARRCSRQPDARAASQACSPDALRCSCLCLLHALWKPAGRTRLRWWWGPSGKGSTAAAHASSYRQHARTTRGDQPSEQESTWV
jgi:hypothetical protein